MLREGCKLRVFADGLALARDLVAENVRAVEHVRGDLLQELDGAERAVVHAVFVDDVTRPRIALELGLELRELSVGIRAWLRGLLRFFWTHGHRERIAAVERLRGLGPRRAHRAGLGLRRAVGEVVEGGGHGLEVVRTRAAIRLQRRHEQVLDVLGYAGHGFLDGPPRRTNGLAAEGFVEDGAKAVDCSLSVGGAERAGELRSERREVACVFRVARHLAESHRTLVVDPDVAWNDEDRLPPGEGLFDRACEMRHEARGLGEREWTSFVEALP